MDGDTESFQIGFGFGGGGGENSKIGSENENAFWNENGFGYENAFEGKGYGPFHEVAAEARASERKKASEEEKSSLGALANLSPWPRDQ